MLKVPLSYSYARLSRRAMAAVIDLACILTLCVLLDTLMSAPLLAADVDSGSVLTMSLCANVLSAALYFPCFECSSAMATPGKAVLGMVVSTMERTPLTVWVAIARAMAKIASILTVGGILIALRSPRHQTLHDRLTNSLVLARH